MKKLVLIGNKPISTDISSIIDSFDFVIRVNRMNNIPNTGYKINGYYLSMNDRFKFIYNGGEHKDLIKEASIIITKDRFLKDTEHIFDYITEAQYKSAETIDYENAKQNIGARFPTSTICCLNHLLTTHWNNDYEIWITGIDIDGRGDMFFNNREWRCTEHQFAGYDEEIYLKNLIKENKIKVLSYD